MKDGIVQLKTKCGNNLQSKEIHNIQTFSLKCYNSITTLDTVK